MQYVDDSRHIKITIEVRNTKKDFARIVEVCFFLDFSERNKNYIRRCLFTSVLDRGSTPLVSTIYKKRLNSSLFFIAVFPTVLESMIWFVRVM